MSSDKTRFSITVDETMFKKIEDFRFDRRIKSQSKAVNELILIGLESLSGNKVTIGPSLSKTQMETIEKYDTLDDHGKVIIDFILEKEYERCAAKKRKELLDFLDDSKNTAPEAAKEAMDNFVKNDLTHSKTVK